MSLAEATPSTLNQTTAESHDKAEKNLEVMAFVLALVLALLWGLSIALFGLPGLYIPAVAAVPVVYVLLLIISQG